ncbi:DUF4123 domain-containing protein [Kangiella shandongensis]|uniref:DUF4123 domain-containing protein n=1 Tax=Kangiella shandongensis TaxID=2763258 RepID=UPI001CBFC34F|nr:DUF4123 domain-containing protein [Kangiella shandongensis]
MTQEHTWISRCHVKQQDASGLIKYYSVQVACTARDTVELHQQLAKHLLGESLELQSIEYSRLIQQHLDKLDYYDQQSVSLAAQAAQQGYAIGELQPIESHSESLNSEGTSYLEIDSLSLQYQHDPKKPSWQQPWIDPELKNLLFKSDIRTYLLVDATSRNRITTTFDLDDYDEVKKQSLYSGQLAQELKQQAPYVIDITLTEEQLGDDNLVPKFHRDFFSNHWGKGTAILLHSQNDINDIVFHLKKFIKIRDTDGKWFYFRFFDPNIMNHYLQSIQRWPQRVSKWYGANGDKQLIRAYFCEDDDGGVANSYHLSQEHQLKTTGKIELTTEEFRLFEDYRWQQNKKLIEKEIRQDFPSEVESLNRNQINNWCEQGNEKGYTTPRALYDYCYAELMAQIHTFDLSQIEQYLSEQKNSHLEKSKLLYESTKDAVERYTKGTKG